MNDVGGAGDPETLETLWQWFDFIAPNAMPLLQVLSRCIDIISDDFQPDFRLADTVDSVNPQDAQLSVVDVILKGAVSWLHSTWRF